MHVFLTLALLEDHGYNEEYSRQRLVGSLKNGLKDLVDAMPVSELKQRLTELGVDANAVAAVHVEKVKTAVFHAYNLCDTCGQYFSAVNATCILHLPRFVAHEVSIVPTKRLVVRLARLKMIPPLRSKTIDDDNWIQCLGGLLIVAQLSLLEATNFIRVVYSVGSYIGICLHEVAIDI